MPQSILVKAAAFASSLALCASVTFLPSNRAQAVDFKYDYDSHRDSINGDDVGGTKYEIFGTAWAQVGSKVFFGIQTNLPLSGTTSEFAHDRFVGWGDLIMKCASITYAVRFAQNNESGVSELGLYQVDSLNSIAEQNGNLTGGTAEQQRRVNRINGPGAFTIGNLDLGFLNGYQGHLPNVIGSGTRIGDAQILSASEITQIGFDGFAGLGGQTIAFSFDAEPLEGLSCLYYVGPECNNDLGGGHMDVYTVPEPAAVLGLAASAGLVLTGAAKRGKREDEVA